MSRSSSRYVESLRLARACSARDAGRTLLVLPESRLAHLLLERGDARRQPIGVKDSPQAASTARGSSRVAGEASLRGRSASLGSRLAERTALRRPRERRGDGGDGHKWLVHDLVAADAIRVHAGGLQRDVLAAISVEGRPTRVEAKTVDLERDAVIGPEEIDRVARDADLRPRLAAVPPRGSARGTCARPRNG